MIFHHIIWDFDGTLFDTYPETARSMQAALHNHGYEYTYQEIYDLMKVSMSAMRRFFGETVGVPNEVFEEYDAIRRRDEVHECPPYEGIPELLRDITAAGGKNYVCTHRDETTFNIMKAYGTYELFEGFATALDKLAPKPNPDSIMFLMEKHGFSAEDAVMIGDREIDIKAGKAAGLKTISFWDGTGSRLYSADIGTESAAEIRAALGL